MILRTKSIATWKTAVEMGEKWTAASVPKMVLSLFFIETCTPPLGIPILPSVAFSNEDQIILR
jgi:hypothetical protein